VGLISLGIFVLYIASKMKNFAEKIYLTRGSAITERLRVGLCHLKIIVKRDWAKFGVFRPSFLLGGTFGKSA